MRINIKFILMLIFVLYGVLVQSQTKINGTYFKSFWWDTQFTVTQPLRWQKQDWVVFGGVALTTTALFFADDEVQVWSQKHRTAQTDFISKYIAEPWGSGWYVAGTVAALYFLEPHQGKTVALQSAKAWILTGGANFILEYSFHRQRPSEGNTPNSNLWFGPSFSSGSTSFPSGHTATAFAVATVISKNYKQKKWVSWLAYSMATLTGLSRINDNKHWASDVFVGGALGYFIGNSVVQNSQKINWGVSINQGRPFGTLVLNF